MAQKCPLTAWRLRHREIEAIPEDDHFSQFLADQGHIVGEIATHWFDVFLWEHKRPPGVNIDEELAARGVTRANEQLWLHTAIQLTQEALNDPDVSAIYEATFKVGNYVTRADILARVRGNIWNMIEVKSITEKRDQDYISDMAYTTAVLRSAGVVVKKIGLMRIDSDFILEDRDQLDADGVLDLMQIVWQWQPAVEQTISSYNAMGMWQFVDHLTASPRRPPPNFLPSCRDCPSCRSSDETCSSILDLPNLGHMQNKFQELVSAGIYCITDIPDGFFSSRKSYEKTAAIVTESVKTGKIFVSTSLKDLLSTHIMQQEGAIVQTGPIKWPCLYLDFEMMVTAVPLFENAHPYQQIPVQYSLHAAEPLQIASDLFMPNKSALKHREYLANPIIDERRKLALQLLDDIDELSDPNVPDSTIFAYHAPVERNCLEYLATLFDFDEPEIANKLRRIASRIVDLLRIVKGSSREEVSAPNFYHPGFKGKFGLKNVIGTLAPSLYSGLDIASGDAALAAYARLAYAHHLDISPWEISDFNQNKILDDLRKYCELDTYSLVVLHEQLALLSVSCPECLSITDIRFYQEKTTLCPQCLQMIKSQQQRRSHALYCPGPKRRQLPRRIAG